MVSNIQLKPVDLVLNTKGGLGCRHRRLGRAAKRWIEVPPWRGVLVMANHNEPGEFINKITLKVTIDLRYLKDLLFDLFWMQH